MNAAKLNQVEVVLDLERLNGPQRMGVLHRQTARGSNVYSFEFDDSWLARKDPLSLDPELLPVPGRNYPPANRTQFGIFMDSSPDRWGRMLMQRREAIDEVNATLNLDIAAAAASSYGLTLKRAREIIDHVRNAAQSWSTEATAAGISRREQERMHEAFSASVGN